MIVELIIFLGVISSETNADCIDGCLCIEGVCSTCNDSSFKENLHCKKCPLDCLTCADGINSFCFNYNRPIGPQHDSDISCDKFCQKCELIHNEFVCKLCPEKSYPIGRHCNACEDHCLDCTDQINCEKCHESCLSCPANCASCKSQSECLRCQAGYYGLTCEKRCSDGCIDSICNKRQGHCNCKHGRHGQYCDRECPENCTVCFASDKCLRCKPGHYGTLCKHRCPVGCLNDLCNNDTGVCSRGCNSNFEGDKCDRCHQGKFGETCDEICPKNCIDCISNRNCTECARGFFGELCDGCNSEYSSQSCVCSDGCMNNKCYQENGTCLEGCKANFEGDLCQSCVSGKYGTNCSLGCPSACNGSACEKNTGNCLNGCIHGMYGSKCDSRCPDNCKQCGDNISCQQCKGEHTSHLCKSKCLDGCHDRCNDIVTCSYCTDGYYGIFCNISCPAHCIDRRCNLTGSCFDCIQGFFGDKCEMNCTSGCCKEVWTRDGSCGNCINDNGLTGEVESVPNTGTVTVVVVLVVIAVTVVVFFSVRVIRRRKLMDMCFSRVKEIKAHFRMELRWTEDLHIETPAEKQTVEVEMIEPNIYQNLGLTMYQDTTTISPACCITLDVEETCDPGDKNILLNPEDESVHIYYNTLEQQQHRIPLDLLRYYVSNKTIEAMAEEFVVMFYFPGFEKSIVLVCSRQVPTRSLPKKLLNTFDVSQREENVTKNRYRGIYPYDKNRVVIRGGNGDYINASFIDGHKKRKSYIACMGPTKNHMDNFVPFWQMVWQENVTTIVMLTNLIEHGFAKCDKYWPDNECTEQYGEISVIGRVEDNFEDYIIRTFVVKKLQYTRVIRQVHFTEWPDKGVPESVSSIIHLQREVRRLREDCEAPLVVHCSAGIGRSGTFIALDILTDEGESEGYVDIYACVRNLREQRVNMVQTLKQYMYLHQAVVESLLAGRGIPDRQTSLLQESIYSNVL